MTRGRAWLVALALGLCAGALYVRLLAGGPVGPVPGGWLRGELVAEPVTDWSFARLARIRVESRARLLPHSTTPWFIVHDGRLHLLLTDLLHGGLMERLGEDPRIRVGVDGRIFEQRAVRVEDPVEVARLVRPGLRKLFAIETTGEIRRVSESGAASLGVYRVETPPETGGRAVTDAPQTLHFSFDYLSSNAWLAWTQLPGLAARYDLAIEPVPVLFAGLLEAHGQLGPAEIPAKIRWMVRNNLRKAALLGVPLRPPVHHPFNPLLALRVSSLSMDASRRTALVDGLFRAVWVESLHVSEPGVVARVADAAGLDGAALVAEAQAPEAKARLRRQTDDAIARGVFGVPSMEVRGELFWGYDDFPQLERFLADRDPLDAREVARWTGTPRPSAVRRRVRGGSEAG